MLILAQILLAKYAEDLGSDTSLGAPINNLKVRVLKDKLILVYDKLTRDITRLPAFQELNAGLADNPHLVEFNRLIINFVNYIEERDLKSIFNYATKLIEKLNELKNSIIRSGLPREKVLQFDAAVHSVQETIWKESKRILNLHDLRGIILHFPELKNILEKPPVPTWDFGSFPKSPAQPRIRQHFDRAKDLMKRLEKENEEEATAKRKK